MQSQRRQVTMTGATESLDKLNLIRLKGKGNIDTS